MSEIRMGAVWFFVFFVGIHMLLACGWYVQRRKDRLVHRMRYMGAGLPKLPLISVLVALHNEETRIAPLLESLLGQEDGNFECVFVDDRSTDGTVYMLEEFQRRAQDKGIPVTIYRLQENRGPNYKQVALQWGFPLCKGEIIALTDGDCRMGPRWIREIRWWLQNPQVAVLLGPVFKLIPSKSFLYFFQSYDQVIRYTYLVGSSAMGRSTGAFGNNMAIKKAALDDIGGYSKIPFSPTEDAALVAEIERQKKWKVWACTSPEMAIQTEPEPAWKKFVQQALRWNKGGLFAPHWTTRLSFGALSGLISIGTMATFFLPWVPFIWPLPVAVLCAMVLNTLLVVQNPFSLPGGLDHLPRFSVRAIPLYCVLLVFEPLFFTFVTILALIGVSVYWKGNRV